MKNIIFINRFYSPDGSATSQILTDLLLNIGGQVDRNLIVITSRLTYENDSKLPRYEIINGVEVHRVWTSGFGRDLLFGRAIDYITFYVSTFFSLLKHVRAGDLIVAKTDPPVISFVAYIAARLKGAYLINWVQDLFPEVAAALGFIKEGSPVYKILKVIKDISLKKAFMNVVIGDRMSGRVLEGGVEASYIKTIHNWNINKEIDFVEKADNYLVNEWGLQGKFVVGYSGNFGRAHEYEAIKGMIQKLKESDDIVFLFIGGGSFYNDLAEFVKIEGIQNVMFKPYQGKDVLNYSLSVPDVHVVSLQPDLEGLIVPSKFYGLASVGTTIIYIGDKEGEIPEILLNNDAGIVIDPSEEEKLVQVVKMLQENAELRRRFALNLKNTYLKKYTPDVAYRKWVTLIKSV